MHRNAENVTMSAPSDSFTGPCKTFWMYCELYVEVTGCTFQIVVYFISFYLVLLTEFKHNVLRHTKIVEDIAVDVIIGSPASFRFAYIASALILDRI